MNSLYFEVIEDFDHLWENYQIGLKKRGEKKSSFQLATESQQFTLAVRLKATRTSTNFPGSEGIHQVAFLYAFPDASLGLDVFHHYSFM